MDVLRLTVPERSQGRLFQYWMSEQVPGLSSSLAKRLLQKGAITINGEALQIEKYEMMAGDVVELDRSRLSLLEPVPMAFDVLYEDEQVIVINKPARLVVHPAKEHPNHTVINGLVARYSSFEPLAPGWPRIVHRLDKDTSGVLIVARSLRAQRFLQKQFRERTTEKEYLALVLGHPESARGTIKGPIAQRKFKSGWVKWDVQPYGRSATTHYKLLESFPHRSLLLVRPITGRTHQIRVHLKAIELPITNDKVYGSKSTFIPQFNRHFLHAARLTITTPDGQRRTFEAPLREELQSVLRDLREESEKIDFSLAVPDRHNTYWFYPPEKRTEPVKPVEPVGATEAIEAIEPIENTPSLIEVLSSFDDLEGFEPIELTSDFEAFDDFLDESAEWDAFDELDDWEKLDDWDEFDDGDEFDEVPLTTPIQRLLDEVVQ